MLRVARTQSLRFSKQFSHSVSMTRWPGGRGGVGQYINNNPLLLRYMIMGSLLGSGGETRQWSGGARLCQHNIPTQNGDEFMLCSSIGWGEERGGGGYSDHSDGAAPRPTGLLTDWGHWVTRSQDQYRSRSRVKTHVPERRVPVRHVPRVFLFATSGFFTGEWAAVAGSQEKM